MTAYLKLTDDEWQLIQPILPIPRRGPKRPHDRSVCAAFCFCRAAGISIESLPLGQFPDLIYLRSTQQRWLRAGTLAEIRRLTMDQVVVTGKATTTLPRWTHVRGV